MGECSRSNIYNYVDIPLMEQERLRTANILKQQQRMHNEKMARYIDEQTMLNDLKLTNKQIVAKNDEQYMNIQKYYRTIQNDKTYDYYNPNLEQGGYVTISMNSLKNVKNGKKYNN